VIETILPGGGAAAAGLQPGDRIVTIDGVAVTEIGEPASVAHIRGLPNTTVTLGLRRGDRAITVAVTRSQVQS
jgi:carboxyl-terminal processing protease